jgi:hypothetical protein
VLYGWKLYEPYLVHGPGLQDSRPTNSTTRSGKAS